MMLVSFDVYMTVGYLLLCMWRISLDSRPSFRFTLDVAKIRHRIDCMLENALPSLTNKTLEAVPQDSFNLLVYQAALIMAKLQRQQSSSSTKV